MITKARRPKKRQRKYKYCILIQGLNAASWSMRNYNSPVFNGQWEIIHTFHRSKSTALYVICWWKSRWMENLKITSKECKVQIALGIIPKIEIKQGNIMKIVKPLLASTCKSIDDLDFSKKFLVTPKLDGIRALKIDGHLISRTFKPIRNNFIRKFLEQELPDGTDGEIVIGPTFQDTSSGVMSEEGEPNFTYYVFDFVTGDLNKPYKDRMVDLEKRFGKTKKDINTHTPHIISIVPLLPREINSSKELLQFEEECLNKGFEGVILRSPDGPYKCGRSTPKENFLIKFKRFEDDEALVIGFVEKMHNTNEAEKDNFGRTKRSSAKDGLVPAGTLGALMVRDLKTTIEFEIGTGLNDEMRNEIWNNQKKYMGMIVRYRHFTNSGVLVKPRFPSFDGFRNQDDL